VTDTRIPLRRALVSVYDKTGLAQLARTLHDGGVELVSTGSTAKTIAAEGIPVTEVSEVTGFPECLDGRVKTLHPRVHAGILADRRKQTHRDQLEELGVVPFDLVVVNLYPFGDTVASGAGFDECVEQIDIGGPSMVRAAAKNHPSVAVVVDPSDYDRIATAVADGGFDLSARTALAARAFAHTASYDVAVAGWLSEQIADGGSPEFLGRTWELGSSLRYGENPHQSASVYLDPVDPAGGGLARAEQLHGKEMSYNNYTDADAAWRAAHDFDGPAVAIIKHANPCGIAVADDVATAHRKAHECDPVSAYGGVIATNTIVTVAMAEQVAEIFTEVLVAPGFDDGALGVLTRKKNIRILRAQPPRRAGTELRPISGGILVQQRDILDADGDDPANWTLAAGDPADEATLADLRFAWIACRSVKSNAILLASDGASVGVGMGQVNRVDSADLAVRRAGDRAPGSVAASDAFFPFPDGLQVLTAGGVRAIVQPGGSIRDAEVIEAADEAGITLYLTGSRHFAH
jgi:phosphoribosylaminoimidazolecarboxamide formyltransferase/IMP cyclohydrolase